MMATENKLVNFVLVGDVRSGASVLASCLNNRRDAVCHLGLFHDNPGVRRSQHEKYFGDEGSDAILTPWFTDGQTNPWHYLNNTVLDNPLRGESAVGVHLPYATVRRWELFELFQNRCNEGDFCVVHVVRNPVACFISLKQAEKSGLWVRGNEQRLRRKDYKAPSPMRIDEAELTQFCRDHTAMRRRIQTLCSDLLEINYADLVDLQASALRLFDFLELPEQPELARPSVRRLANHPVERRIANFAEIRCTAPSDVRQYMSADDLV